jgi:hypothetical protein
MPATSWWYAIVRGACTRVLRSRALRIACALSVAPPVVVSAQPSSTAIVERIRSTGGRPIDFHAAVFPESVFVGEQATYQVAVLLSDEARTRLRRNPEFLPPELRGLLAYELSAPQRVAPRSYGGGVYEAHVFQRALFAVAPGVLSVPSPQLSYSLPQSSSYFSREERFVVRAESAQLVVRPLPEQGRPADFTGAVGVLRATARLDATGGRVGDPLVLTVRVEGTGNVKLLPRPVVELSWASVVPGSERLQVDSSGARVRGAKEFDYILTPARSGRVVMPVIRYPYFDPYREAYSYAETSPADVMVADGTLAAVPDDEQPAELPLRPWRGEIVMSMRSLPAWAVPLTGALVLLSPLPALALLLRTRRRRRPPHPTPITGDLAASGGPVEELDATPRGVARRARRTVLQQLATRLQVVPAELVTRADFERVLRRRGVTRDTTKAALELLDNLALQGYGAHPDVASPQDSAQRRRTDEIMARIDAEAVRQARTPLFGRRARQRAALGLVVLLSGALGTHDLRAMQAGEEGARGRTPVTPVQTAPPGDAASCTRTAALLVQEGEAAYEGHRYVSAAERFATAAQACPGDVDLLVNWGTAAWAAYDTVAAVVAWHRAARLDPLASDIQERMALLPSGARGGVAEVHMVPFAPLVVLGVSLWLLGWGMLAVEWRQLEPNGVRRVVALSLLVAATGAAGVAWWGQQRLDGVQLAVVRRPDVMRSAPGGDANSVGGVATGDVVRQIASQESWWRVRHADGREGWLLQSRLTPLHADAPIR